MKKKTFLSFLCAAFVLLPSGLKAGGPRIVNFINFVRYEDYRAANSVERSYEATLREATTLKQHNLPGTFLLQYDALIAPSYQKLFLEGEGKGFEVGGWLEITEPHAKDAGIAWRGKHAWDPAADVDFLTGYTQAERRKLIDTFMEKFREVFGRYPASMGSWFIDAYSLEYMEQKYHVVASCNCKDQVGTDGYTLWGGYWNGAYYPSRTNGYMPAQTQAGGVAIPVFRMLGSDPIYQYGTSWTARSNGQDVFSLEPACVGGGDNRQWTLRYLDAITDRPCLAYNYTQTGQENSFFWERIGKGLVMQAALIDSLRKAGKVTVQTLEESGRWFKKHFKLTPPTAVVAEVDTRNEGNAALWFNSRFYRASVEFDHAGSFRLRDVQLFDERFTSPYYAERGRSTRLLYFALPVVDGLFWSNADTLAGLRLVRPAADGSSRPIDIVGHEVTEKGNKTLVLSLRSVAGEEYTLLFGERGFILRSKDAQPWALELATAQVALPFTNIGERRVEARYKDFNYCLALRKGSFEKPDGKKHFALRLVPQGGQIDVNLSERP